VAVTAMLTLIAYRFAIGNSLPKLSYLTRMDIFIFGATLLIFVAFVKVIVEAGLVHAEKLSVASRIDGVCRWLFPTGAEFSSRVTCPSGTIRVHSL
jgi:hypothetical protein